MAYNFSVILRASENISAPFRRSAEAAQQMADATDRFSASARAANNAFLGMATVADAAIGLISVQAAKLEDALARLEISTESTTQSMSTSLANAEESARKFSTEFSVSAAELITAQVEIAQAGIAIEEQISATQGAFKLAQATMGDFGQAAQLLGSFLNTFGKSAEFNYLNPAEKIESITDRLSRTVQRFQVTLPVLAESFKFVIGPASQLGLSFAETNTALGILNTAGFRGSLAGTALSNMFNKLDRAVEKLDLNPEKFIDINGNLKDLSSFLLEVNRALSNSTPIEAQNKLIEVFDIRAGRVIKTLLNNVDALQKFTAELDIAQGVTESMANTLQQTTSSQFQKFLNTLQNIGTSIGTSFNDGLKSFLPSLQSTTNAIAGFAERNKDVIATIATVGAGLLTVTALSTAFTLVATRVGGALLAIATASRTAAIAIGATIAALRLAQIAFVGGAIAVAAISIGETVSSIIGFFKGENGLASVLISAGVAALSLAVAFRSLGAAIAFIRNAATIAAAFTGIRAAAIALIATLGGVGLAIAAIGGAIYGSVKAFESIKNAITGTEQAAIKAPRTFEEIDKQFGNSLQTTSKYVGELDRLGKALRNNLDAPVARGTDFGALPISDNVGKIFKDSGKSLADSIKQALSEIKGDTFTGLTDQFANAIGESSVVVKAYAESFETLRSKVDPAFASLNDLEREAEFLKSLMAGSELAFEQLSKGSLETGESLKKLLSDLEKFRAADSSETNNAFLNALFENFSKNVDNLRRVDIPAIQEGIKVFDKAKFDNVELTKSSSEFAKIVGLLEQVKSAFNSLKGGGQLFAEALRGVDTATKGVTNAGKSIENIFKNASIGTGNYADAIVQANARLEDARNNLAAFDVAVENLRKRFDSLGDKFINTQAFQAAKTELDKIADTRINLVLGINANQVEIESARILGIISKGGRKLSDQQVTDIKRIGEAFSNSIGTIFTDKLTGADAFKKLSNEFKNLFINDVQKEIGLLIGNKFKDQFRSAVLIAQKIIETEFDAGRLFDSINDGSLPKKINEALRAGGIDKITGDDIFDLGKDNKLTEKFADITTDIRVALVNADAQSAALLDNLERITQTGPGKSFIELTKQAADLTELLQRAGQVGSKDAIRPIESALKEVLDQLNNNERNPAAKLLDAGKLSASALSNSASELATAIQGIIPAGKQFNQDVVQALNQTLANLTGIPFAINIPEQSNSAIGQQTTIPPVVPASNLSADSGIPRPSDISVTAPNVVNLIEPVIDLPEIKFPESKPFGLNDILKPNQINTDALLQSTSGVDRRNQQQPDAGTNRAEGAVDLSGVNSIVEQLTRVQSSISGLTANIRIDSDSIINAAESLIPVANEFSKIISGTFDKVVDKIKSNNDNQTVSANKDGINITVNLGDRQFNITVGTSSGSQTGQLTDADIRSITADVRRDMAAEIEETIRKLEDELRRR